MKSRTLAVAGSIAALSFAALPVVAQASPDHHGTKAAKVDRSRDRHGVKHIDKSKDRSHDLRDRSRDLRDR